MKKSEMVYKLDELLDTHTSVSSSCCNLGLSKENLDKVIDGLTAAGMLPPFTKVKLTEREARLATDWLALSEGVKRVNDWDEE